MEILQLNEVQPHHIFNLVDTDKHFIKECEIIEYHVYDTWAMVLNQTLVGFVTSVTCPVGVVTQIIKPLKVDKTILPGFWVVTISINGLTCVEDFTTHTSLEDAWWQGEDNYVGFF